MKLSWSLNSVAARGHSQSRQISIPLQQGEVIAVGPDGTPMVKLDDGTMQSAGLAIDYPMTVGLRVYALPSAKGLTVIGIIS